MMPLDKAFQIIEEENKRAEKPIGKIHKVYDDGRGVVVEFSLFPDWEIDEQGFLRNKNRPDFVIDNDIDYFSRHTMHG